MSRTQVQGTVSVNHSMQNLIFSALFTNQISHTCGEKCVANYDCVIRNKAKEITSKIEVRKAKGNQYVQW